MWKLSTLLLVLVASATFPNVSEARAWDDDEDDFFNSESEEEEVEPPQAQPKSSGILSADPHADHVPTLLSAGFVPAPQASNATLNQTVKQTVSNSFGGVQGGNYAAHNESCSPTGKRCHDDSNLQCSATDGTGRCACIIGFVYVRETETCWEIPASRNDPCAHDAQCHAGRWGKISRCNKHTARCECYDYQYQRNTTSSGGICYIQKIVGDLCHTNEECSGPIDGPAYCKPGDHQSGSGQRYNGTCQCVDGNIWHNPTKACLPLAQNERDPCKVDLQCQKTFGGMSWCSLDKAYCECHAWRPSDEGNTTETVFYPPTKKCYYRKQFNESCEVDGDNGLDACRASLGPDVDCGTTDQSPDKKVCHCPKGRTCRSSAFTVAPTGLAWTTAVGVAVLSVGLVDRGCGWIGN